MYLLDINRRLQEMTKSAESFGSLDLIWGAEDIAKAIGRSTRATFEMLQKGEIPAKRVSGRWVIARSELVAFFVGTAA